MGSASSSQIRIGMRMAAQGVIAVGIALLLVVLYLVVWTGHETAQSQAELRTSFEAGTESAKPPSPGTPQGIAVLHIPALGKKWEWVVVEGVDAASLGLGPGHFPQTVMPGQVGNFAVAGHRATHGQPFARLDKLKAGGLIVVETAQGWFSYRVTWNKVLPATATEVLEPVPGKPGVAATTSTITLVTCHPRWDSTERLVVAAELVDTRTASAGPPAGIAS